ncbi:MAG: hypothetical protein DYG89_54695 [Caldilinea sp. CFX5]|nr:hypothetical protein [Caldilinea sp. CFX5]
MSRKQITRITLKALGYGLAFLLPVVGLTYVIFSGANNALIAAPAQPFTGAALPPPMHDPAKPTVAIIASNNGTEITDLLAPYEVFAASGAFNVYTVAPKRVFTPFMWGGVDIMPHYSFAELDQLLGKNPDVVVIPFIKDYNNQEIIQWIRSHAGPETVTVSICGGALVLAATGLVDDGKVTTHQGVFPVFTKQFPTIAVVKGVRYTDNGNTITSAGITAGIDASLHVVRKLAGKAVAVATAQKMNYPYVQFLDDPAYQPPARKSVAGTDLNAGFLWFKQAFGVYLYEGVGETDLTAVLDTYGRTYTARTVTFAEKRAIMRSRHGLYLIPRWTMAEIQDISRVLVPGSKAAIADANGLESWAQQAQQLPVEYLYQPGDTTTFAFDVTLPDLAKWSNSADARDSALTLEYPSERLDLGSSRWAFSRLFPTLLVGVATVLVVYALDRRRSTRRTRLSLQPLTA